MFENFELYIGSNFGGTKTKTTTKNYPMNFRKLMSHLLVLNAFVAFDDSELRTNIMKHHPNNTLKTTTQIYTNKPNSERSQNKNP